MTHHRSRLALCTLTIVLALAVPGRPAHAGIISGYKWYPMGPAPSFQFFPGGETGRATAIAVNPANADDIWVGTAGGGVWHSVNGGKNWSPMTDDQASLAIGSIVLAGCTTGGCNQVYAGTGENAIRRDTYYGAGLLIGTVNGASYVWTLRDGKPLLDFTHGSIYNVVLDPNTSGASQVIYITMSSGVTASATESTVTAPPPMPGGFGIFKSSDNGVSWTKLFSAGRPTDLEMDRTNSGILYAGFLGRGIFKSTDGGATWCPVNPGLPKPNGCPATTGLPDTSLATTMFDHVEIDIARTDHTHLYATFGQCADRLVADCAPMVYESTDAGLNWTQRFAGDIYPTLAGFDLNCPHGYSRYTHGLTVHPADPNILFLTGFHLCESLDRGASWFATDDNTNGFMLHPDHHAVAFYQADPNRVYDVNDGGVALSTDGGTTWTPSIKDLANVEFQSIATSALTSRIIGGTQDNSGMMWLGSKQWTNLPCCGDGGFAVLDRTNVNNMYLTTNTGGLAGLTVVPVRSFDGGKNFPSPGQFPNYDIGINTSEARSFYPPFFQSVSAPFFFGTNRLFRSNNSLTNWFAQSPTFSTDPETEIFSLADAITAIAEAPSNTNRMYVGMYSGKLFVTNAACTNSSCWPQRNAGLPAAPITWIAVDPTQPDTAYATLSGFFAGIHVYKTTNAGVSWSPTGSIADLTGVPANTIAIDPSDTNILWLGTDKGVYKSTNGGAAWFRFSNGLPNVPVYALALDGPNGRLVAATHGRGAWILTPVFLGHYVDGPIHKLVLDQPVFGHAFRPNQGCGLKILRANGTVCASGSIDALGGTLMTDAEGFLVSSKAGVFSNLPVVWACAMGKCLGTDIKSCNQPGNPMATLEATCGSQIAVSPIKNPGPIGDPPSSLMTLGQPGPVQGPMPSSGSFQVLPAVQVSDGSSRLLCVANVSYSAGEDSSTILQHARDAINTDPACEALGVSAEFLPAASNGEVEDLFEHPGHLRIMAPTVSGSELIPAMRADAGQSTGICFNASRLGNPVLDQIRAMKVRFATFATGAMGGAMTLKERSSMGECSVTVPTIPGQTAAGIADALEQVFKNPGPINSPGCPAGSNPRDVVRKGDALLTALPSEIVVCSTDPGVGVAMAPQEICLSDADCDDGNPCTSDSCNPATGQCQNASVPNGVPCNDGDACTIGGTCQSGTCGTPVVCNDRNACTTDSCDPATGACLSQPVACDDGNNCTSDLCNPDTGQCLFVPQTGSTCDDGDLCTSGDTCVTAPGNPVPTCQGNAKCADTDACTADLCEPNTGVCSNPPIVCDDGNSCTLDVCQSGACNSIPAPSGQPCDDGDRCTLGDTCVGGAGAPPVCQGSALSCNDGNTCTMDQCNPISGSCEYINGVQPGPISDVTLNPQPFPPAPTQLQWTAEPAAQSYDVVYGDVAVVLGGGGNFGAAILGCVAEDTTGTTAVDANPGPVQGQAFFYLVRGSNCGGPGTWNEKNPGPVQIDRDAGINGSPNACHP
ncbi:MAG TPA: hypothetical protein VFE84_10840 [Patescibacteria group bacterium]|nr:hypothetical protein [Patescibacteria group bacterium]